MKQISLHMESNAMKTSFAKAIAAYTAWTTNTYHTLKKTYMDVHAKRICIYVKVMN